MYRIVNAIIICVLVATLFTLNAKPADAGAYVSNCSVSIIDHGTYVTVNVAFYMRNVKNITVYTTAYNDRVLSFSETNYSEFSQRNGYTGTYNYTAYPTINDNTKTVYVSNQISLVTSGNRRFLYNCSSGARL